MEIGSKTYDIVTVRWIKSVCGMGKIWKQTKKTKNQKNGWIKKNEKKHSTILSTIIVYSLLYLS